MKKHYINILSLTFILLFLDSLVFAENMYFRQKSTTNDFYIDRAECRNIASNDLTKPVGNCL